jgi:hypothetical protein
MTALPRLARLMALLCAAPAPLLATDGNAADGNAADGNAADGTSGRNPAAAQALFEEAQKRVAAGDFEAACPKFKASYALDPGGGTLLNLADCLEKQGRKASAWSTFKDALVVAQRDGRSERVHYAQQHIRSLEGQLGYLTVEVPPTSRAAELAIEVDGTPLVSAAWGEALPMDPGEHVIRAHAPGFEPFEHRVTLEASEGARQTLVVPELHATVATKPAPGAPLAAPPVVAAETQYPARTWGWVTGGVGLVALGVGSYFGVQAFSHWDERNEGCVDGCTPEAKAAGEDADHAATLATVGVSAGVVLLATATVLLLYSTDAEAAPQTSSAAGLSLDALDRGAVLGWKGRF